MSKNNIISYEISKLKVPSPFCYMVQFFSYFSKVQIGTFLTTTSWRLNIFFVKVHYILLWIINNSRKSECIELCKLRGFWTFTYHGYYRSKMSTRLPVFHWFIGWISVRSVYTWTWVTPICWHETWGYEKKKALLHYPTYNL